MDKKENLFFKIVSKFFIAFLILFIVLYISGMTGYYEYEQHKRVVLNEEKIKEFENDVKKGKNIKATDYINEVDVSYQNGISTVGYTLSNQIGIIIGKGMDSTLSFLGKLFQG